MKQLGDTYVKNEFQQHKAAKPEQLNQFFKAWDSYLVTLSNQEDVFGQHMTTEDKQKLNMDQVGKMNDLRAEVSNVTKDEDDSSAPYR